jgi:predicted DCC family thiol-disulfide oxidoreductase YuxK
MESPIILFDGVCNLCNTSVQFVIEHDPTAIFRFASLQSDAGQAILAKNALNTEGLNSVILVENEVIYDRSTAALRIAKRLSGGVQLLAVFLIVPRFIRDFVYKIVAKNRYRWFGKQEVCWLPTKELKARFLT